MVVITENCIQCGACESVCPESAISEQGGQYVIDQALCKECLECIETCPNEAIVQQ